MLSVFAFHKLPIGASQGYDAASSARCCSMNTARRPRRRAAPVVVMTFPLTHGTRGFATPCRGLPPRAVHADGAIYRVRVAAQRAKPQSRRALGPDVRSQVR